MLYEESPSQRKKLLLIDYQMHTEHHIDSFDLPSFFKLHDLNMDGFWDTAEIQAVYGLKHDASHNHGHAKMDPVDIEEKRTRVLAGVLDRLDSNKDGELHGDSVCAGRSELTNVRIQVGSAWKSISLVGQEGCLILMGMRIWVIIMMKSQSSELAHHHSLPSTMSLKLMSPADIC